MTKCARIVIDGETILVQLARGKRESDLTAVDRAALVELVRLTREHVGDGAAVCPVCWRLVRTTAVFARHHNSVGRWCRMSGQPIPPREEEM